MEQNTDEWRKWRHGKIGASDATVIMGKSPYQKRHELLLEKTTEFEKLPVKESSPVANLGHVVEEMERPRFEFMEGKKFMPALLTHPEFSWLSASYDGLTMDETEAWEHKLTGKDTFAIVEKGLVPDKFRPQVQQQFLVNPKLKKVHLCCVLYKSSMLGHVNQDNFRRAKVIVERDDLYIQNQLFPELQKFHREVILNSDFSFLEKLADRIDKMKSEIEKIDLEKSVLEDELKKLLLPIGKVATSKWTLSYTMQSKTSYDIDKMVQDFSIEKDKYKKTGAPYYTLKVTKKKEK